MQKIIAGIRRFSVIAVSAVLVLVTLGVTRPVEAASLTSTDLRISRIATSSTSSLRLVFRTTSAGATTISINMNGTDATSWVGAGGVVNAAQTVSSASCATETGATALPGALAASGASPTISITGLTALSATTTYCVDLTSTSAVTTPSSAGEYHPLITVGSDSVTVAERIITNDQVVVSAVVPPTFNFVLSGNSDSFTTNLSSGSVATTTGVTATINTNAKTGWIAWAKDANSGLTSATAAKTIGPTTAGTSATLSTGTEGYTLGITAIAQGSGAGTTTAATAYDATGAAHGSGVDTSLRQIASSTGTASSAIITIKERAAITTTTPAANDYTDTVTIIGAAKF